MPPSPYTNFRLPPRRKAANENNILLKKWEQNTGYHPYDPKRNGTRKAQTAPNWLKNAIRTQNFGECLHIRIRGTAGDCEAVVHFKKSADLEKNGGIGSVSRGPFLKMSEVECLH